MVGIFFFFASKIKKLFLGFWKNKMIEGFFDNLKLLIFLNPSNLKFVKLPTFGSNISLKKMLLFCKIICEYMDLIPINKNLPLFAIIELKIGNIFLTVEINLLKLKKVFFL